MRKNARKFTTLISLFALAASVFFAAFPFAKTEAETDKVYCPLTKKLQPVHASKQVVRKTSLDDFCAADEKKVQFEQSLVATQKLISFGEIQFENLAFDFFQNGKVAFKNLPNLPNFPQENLAKSHYSATGAGNFARQIFFAEIKNFAFDFAQNLRPPTFRAAIKFDLLVVRDLKEISQNINPRSPPENLS